MPPKPKKPCAHPGCKNLVQGERYCLQHKKESQQRYDKERGTSAQRGYDARWRRESKLFLNEHPLCAECLKGGNEVPAVLVDHTEPHKGDPKIFWDKSKWQGLCWCHHSVKTAQKDGGFGNKRA